MAVEFAHNDLDRFVSVPEAAARLSLHADTARAWIRSGRWEQEFPGVPILTVAGKRVVPLRRIAEFIEAQGRGVIGVGAMAVGFGNPTAFTLTQLSDRATRTSHGEGRPATAHSNRAKVDRPVRPT